MLFWGPNLPSTTIIHLSHVLIHILSNNSRAGSYLPSHSENIALSKTQVDLEFYVQCSGKSAEHETAFAKKVKQRVLWRAAGKNLDGMTQPLRAHNTAHQKLKKDQNVALQMIASKWGGVGHYIQPGHRFSVRDERN